MNFDILNRWFKAPRLTRTRIGLALVVAAGADGLQMLLMQFGWVGPDQVIDVTAAVIIARLIGFHILLLPTLVVELIPVLDDLPTWLACTAAVIALRKREQSHIPPPSPIPPPVPVSTKPVIDV
jgi:hypothetical protein